MTRGNLRLRVCVLSLFGAGVFALSALNVSSSEKAEHPFSCNSSGVAVKEKHGGLLVCGSGFGLVYHLDEGTWDFRDAKGMLLLEGAQARAGLVKDSAARKERWFESRGQARRSWMQEPVCDGLGEGVRVRVRSQKPGEPALVSIFTVYPGKRFYTVAVSVEDFPENLAGFRVRFLEPQAVHGPGAFYLGREPARHKILDNGSNLYFDFYSRLSTPVERPPFPVWLFSMKSRSNWNSVIFDPESGRSALQGFVTHEAAFTLIITDYKPARARTDQGRKGFTEYTAQCWYRPAKPPGKGGSLCSEVLLVDFLARSPFQALEDYADHIADYLDIRVWSGPVPNGWNSWGEYYCDINEEIILKNAEVVAQRLKPFGMNFFQIDCGWMPCWGDWEADPNRFPHGMKWLADRIRDMGLEPQIWIAPFVADLNSRIYREHPEWFLEKRGLLAKFLIQAEGYDLQVLNLTLPEVQEHLRQVIQRITREWGFTWLKVDFAYNMLVLEDLGDPARTNPEIYRMGMRLLREAAGEDVFIVGVSMMGLNYGLVDADRVNMDIMPAWSEADELFHIGRRYIGFVQGVMPTVRIVARRYWLNYRVWINHPDLIFFNNDRYTAWTDTPLSFEECLTYASVVGLEGGIIKIGDRIVEMTDREIDVIRRLLPIYKAGARPVDLFCKDNPEIWDLKVESGIGKWDVVGVFNWGRNRVDGVRELEHHKEITVDFNRIGLDPEAPYLAFDFWNEKFLGEHRGSLTVALAPRSVVVVSIRPLLSRPQFISTNRHITQGATEIEEICWDQDRKRLAGRQEVVPGYEYHLSFHVPEGYELSNASVNGGPAQVWQNDKWLMLKFILEEQDEEVLWQLQF